MLDHLVEYWVLLLFKLPVGNIGGGQPSWSCTNSYLWAGFLVVWIRPHSLLKIRGTQHQLEYYPSSSHKESVHLGSLTGRVQILTEGGTEVHRFLGFLGV